MTTTNNEEYAVYKCRKNSRVKYYRKIILKGVKYSGIIKQI